MKISYSTVSQVSGLTLLQQTAPHLVWAILEFYPAEAPLCWRHAELMRAPVYAVELACRFPARATDRVLGALLRAAYIRTHANAARQQATEQQHGAAAAGSGQPNAALQLVTPPLVSTQLSFDEVLRRQEAFLGREQAPEPHTALNAQLTWRYRRCLNRSAKSAIRQGNLLALAMLRASGWDVPAEHSALLLVATEASQPQVLQYLLAHGAQLQERAALCMEVAAGKQCLLTLGALLAAGAAAEPVALRAGLVAAAAGGQRATLQRLLEHIEQQRGSQGDRWRGDVAVALADALQIACSGGQAGSVGELIGTPLHPGCVKWGASTLPSQGGTCPACLWQLRRGLLAAAECGCAETAEHLLRACSAAAPPGLELWASVGDETATEALHQAAQRGMQAVVALLLREGVHEALPAAAAAAAAAAAGYGQVMTLWTLQQYGVDALRGGQSPLVQAACGGHWQCLSLLLAAGGDPCAANGEGLVMAARYNHMPAARLLLGLAADASHDYPSVVHGQPDAAGPAEAAAMEGGLSEVEGGVAPMPHDSILHSSATVSQNTQSSQAMLAFVRAFRPEHKCDVRVRQDAALREAAGRGHHDMVQLLLEQGADASSVRNHALFRAMEGGHVRVAALLLGSGHIVPGHDEAVMAQRSPAKQDMVNLLQQYAVTAQP